MKATHILKKRFVTAEKATIKKGTLACINEAKTRVAFLTETGEVSSSPQGWADIFSLIFFSPESEFFDPIKSEKK